MLINGLAMLWFLSVTRSIVLYSNLYWQPFGRCTYPLTLNSYPAPMNYAQQVGVGHCTPLVSHHATINRFGSMHQWSPESTLAYVLVRLDTTVTIVKQSPLDVHFSFVLVELVKSH